MICIMAYWLILPLGWEGGSSSIFQEEVSPYVENFQRGFSFCCLVVGGPVASRCMDHPLVERSHGPQQSLLSALASNLPFYFIENLERADLSKLACASSSFGVVQAYLSECKVDSVPHSRRRF